MPATWFSGTLWTVEIAFASNPGASSQTWTDVTSYVRGFSSKIGRNDELDRFTAGRMVVELDNRDRRFDPTYTAGPYYGTLLPRRRIRIRPTYSTVTYDLFEGVVDDWPQSWEPPRNASVQLSCTDLSLLLSLATVPSWYDAYVGSLAPSTWWPLGTDQGTDRSGNGRNGAVDAAQPQLAPALIANTPSGASTSDVQAGFYVGPSGAATTTAVTVAFMAKIPLNAEPLNEAVRVWASQNTSGLYVQLNTTWNFGSSVSSVKSALYVSVTTSGTTLERNYAADVLADGLPHHIAVTVSGTTVTAYVDGAPVGYVREVGSMVTPSFDDRCSVQVLRGGTIDEALWFKRALSATEVNRLTGAARGDLVLRTDEWLTLALDDIGWPAGDRTISTDGRYASQPQTGSVLAIGRQLEEAEQGRLFIDQAGTVVFRTLSWGLTAARTTVVQQTFGDSTGELGYTDLSTDQSGERIANVWTVGDSTAEDTTSIATYFRLAQDRSSLAVLPTQDASTAAWLLSRYKDASARVASLTVAPRAAPATLVPAVLGIQIGDLIRVRRRPQSIGSPIELDVTVEGIAHQVSRDGGWRVTFETGKRWVAGPSSPLDEAVLWLDAATTSGYIYATVDDSVVDGVDLIAP